MAWWMPFTSDCQSQVNTQRSWLDVQTAGTARWFSKFWYGSAAVQAPEISLPLGSYFNIIPAHIILTLYWRVRWCYTSKRHLIHCNGHLSLSLYNFPSFTFPYTSTSSLLPFCNPIIFHPSFSSSPSSSVVPVPYWFSQRHRKGLVTEAFWSIFQHCIKSVTAFSTLDVAGHLLLRGITDHSTFKFPLSRKKSCSCNLLTERKLDSRL